MHTLFVSLLSYGSSIRKNLIWLFVLGLSSISFYGQNAVAVNQFNVNSTLGVYNVSAPNMASFQKVTHIPMNPYTGRANVTIPLYEIQSGDLSVPISISYNTSGVKIDDIPSSVGSNWSLSAGGSVNKTVKGLEDFYYKAEVTPGVANHYTLKSLGWSHRLDYASHSSMQTLLGNTLPFALPANNGTDMGTNAFNLQTKYDDSRPDLFTANAPGLSTSFVHRLDKSVMELHHQGNAIVSSFGESAPINLFGFDDGWQGLRPIKCVTNITVTNPQGITYNFGNLDISQSADVFHTKSRDREKKYEIYSYNQVDAYHLSSIKSNATHREIKFQYDTYSLSSSEVKLSQVKNYLGSSLDTGTPLNPFVHEAQFLKTKHPQLNRIHTILFEEGSVEFIYAKNREDLVGDKALTTIKIKDFHGEVVKTFEFEYSYFTSGPTCTTPECKRLQLNRIRIFNKVGGELPGYVFSYDTTVSLPPRGTYNQDYLGYANGPAIPRDGYPAFPTLYFSANKGTYSFFPVPLGQDYRELPGDYSMVPNLKYAKAGVLTAIKYPTGASTQFSYELNSFLVNTKEIEGGGLRIKSQRIIDQTGHQEILDYRYIDTDWQPSGRLNAIPTYGTVKIGYGDSTDGNLQDLLFEVYSSSQFQAELTDGAYVGYSRVLIKNRENHGITENIYTSSKDEPNIEAPVYDVGTLFNNTTHSISEPAVSFYSQNGGFKNVVEDNGLFRGQLKLQRLYDATGKLVQRTNITYAKDISDSFSADLIQIEGDYIDPSGDSHSRSKYYTQKLDIASKRYMKVSESVKDFYNDGTTKTIQTHQQYHPTFPVVKEEKVTNSLGLAVKNKFYYPDEKISLSNLSTTESLAIDHLVTANRYTTPIQKETYVGDKKVQTQRTGFNTWANSIIAPASIQTAKESTTLENRIDYKQYDPSGNVLSVLQTGGVETSYIYGYKNSVIIAVLKNVPYQDIPQTTISQLQQLSSEDVNAATEQTFKDALDGLRDTFKQGQITTYTYNPLIGVTSTTDPLGITTYYQYDDFNRLQTIRDHYGKILKEYCYGYKGANSPCNRVTPVTDINDIVGNESSKVYIEVGVQKDYRIPIPNELDVLEYYWAEIENTEYKYKSLHPVLYFPRPRLPHGDGIPSTPIDLRDFNLFYPDSFYSSGWTATRQGMSYKLIGKHIDPLQDRVQWGIVLANGKEIPMSKTVFELSDVLFPVPCLDGVTGKIFCKITPKNSNTSTLQRALPETSEVYYSKPIVFKAGLTSLDNISPHAFTSSNASVCEIIASIPLDPIDPGSGTTDFDIPWSYSDWDVNLEQDPDVTTITIGGSGNRNTALDRIKVNLTYGKYKIPIPNDFNAMEFPWTEGNRPSLHPVFYYPRPHLIDNITIPSASHFNSIFKRQYPNSYYSSGWYSERGGYRYYVTGLEGITVPYTTQWFIETGNTRHPIGVFIPETTEIFFVPRSLIGKTGQVVCRVILGPKENPDKILDIKSEIVTFQEGLLSVDMERSTLTPFDLQN